MKSYGAQTPKRHLGYSNARVVEKLYRANFTRAGQANLLKTKGKVSTVKRYRDKRGKVRFVGTPYLKKSQQGPQLLWIGSLANLACSQGMYTSKDGFALVLLFDIGLTGLAMGSIQAHSRRCHDELNRFPFLDRLFYKTCQMYACIANAHSSTCLYIYMHALCHSCMKYICSNHEVLLLCLCMHACI